MTDTMSRADAQTRPDKPGVQNDPVIEQLEKQFAAVTRDEAVQAVMKDVRCCMGKAEDFYDFLVRTAAAAESGPEVTCEVFLSVEEVVVFHDIMSTVMPDDVVAVRGSGTTQDLLERSMPTEVGEIQFIHTKDSSTGDDCVIRVTIRRPSN